MPNVNPEKIIPPKLPKIGNGDAPFIIILRPKISSDTSWRSEAFSGFSLFFFSYDHLPLFILYIFYDNSITFSCKVVNILIVFLNQIYHFSDCIFKYAFWYKFFQSINFRRSYIVLQLYILYRYITLLKLSINFYIISHLIFYLNYSTYN